MIKFTQIGNLLFGNPITTIYTIKEIRYGSIDTVY